VPKFFRSQQDIYISTSILPPFPTSVTPPTPSPTSRSPAPSRQILQPSELIARTSPSSKTKIREYLNLPCPPIFHPSYLKGSFIIHFPTSRLGHLSFFPVRNYISSRLKFHPPFPPMLPLPNPDSASLNSTGKGRREVLSIYCLLFSYLQTQTGQVESKAGRCDCFNRSKVQLNSRP